MSDPVTRAADLDQNTQVSRRLLAEMDEAAADGIFFGHVADRPGLPAIGLCKTSAIAAGVSVLGLLATFTLLPEPSGASLEDFTEDRAGGDCADREHPPARSG
jgi:hypothetical protein